MQVNVKNSTSLKKIAIVVFAGFVALLLLPHCAKVMSPSGGPKDTLAPVLTHCVPPLNTTNFKGHKLIFTFNEFIQLKDHQKKMLVSPPLKQPPIVTLKGKKILFEIVDTLQDNTTYTLYLGNSIEDNNERNPLSNFEFAFSTGPTIDSLGLAGVVTDAFTNKPVEGALVMLYSTFDDSIPYKQKPVHVAKTLANGAFRVNNLKDIDYKVVAIVDGNSDYLYNQGAELVGFRNEIVSAESLIRPNDTIKTADSIRMRLFKEELPSQIITSYEHKTRNAFRIFFSRVPVGEVNVKPLNFKPLEHWYIIEPDNNGDSLTYWITDTSLYSLDTLKLAVGYQKTDSLNHLHPAIDTLTMLYFADAEEEESAQRAGQGRSGRGGAGLLGMGGRGRDKQPPDSAASKPPNPLNFSIKNNQDAKTNVPLVFTLPCPVQKVDNEGIKLFNDTDSTMEATPQLVPDSICPRKYSITRSWEAGKVYKMLVLPNTFSTYQNKPFDTLRVTFKGADPEQYGAINLALSNFNKGVVVELLTERGQLVEAKAVDTCTTVTFNFISPGKYRMRIIDDLNVNGKWDSGCLLRGLQPEWVYPYSNAKREELLEVRANWEMDLQYSKPKMP